CPDGKFKNGGSCIEGCPAGTFPIPPSEYYECDASCATCSGPGPNQCKTCRADGDYVLGNGHCNVVCPAGKYKGLQGDCLACNSACATCDGSATTCTSCAPGQSLSGSTCACPNSQYRNAVGDCSTCDSSCTACAESPSTCSACAFGFSLSGSSCQPCVDGSYPSAPGVCSTCGSGCTACVGSASQCTSCALGYAFDATTSSCTPCPEGTYGSSAGVCATCPTGTKSQNGGCVPCPAGTYGSNPGVCSACDSLCATCDGAGPNKCKPCPNPYCRYCSDSDPNVCISCSAGSLSPSPGVCICPANRYYTGTACAACNSRCATCAGGSSTSCLSCFPGMSFVQNGPASTTGSCQCPSNQFFTGSGCADCHPTCKTCSASGSSSCLTCDPPFQVKGGICGCPDGQYRNGNICSPCSPHCTTCDGPEYNQCLTCPDGGPPNSLNSCDRGGSPPPRRKRNYAIGGSCGSCHGSCATCSGPASTDCLSCAPPSKLTADGQCADSCPPRTTPDTSGSACVNCDASCASCSGTSSDECTSCSLDATLCGGKCVPGPLCPSPRPSPDRRAYRSGECPRGLTPCAVPGRSFRSWECVDTRNDLESCGGCSFSGLNKAETTGQDCTALPGVADVSCLHGRCTVMKCMPGYDIHHNRTQCVESPRWLHLEARMTDGGL
ncbi:insulin-like growth factor binding protein, partial [Favolaschia claudopus]